MTSQTALANPPSPPVHPTRERRPRASLWLLRVVVLIHLLLVVSQPISMGQYMSGVFGALDMHSIIGSTLVLATMLLGVAALVYVLCGGRVWVLPGMVALFLAEGFQIGMGHSRNLSLHVPLGVLIVTLAILLFIWVWMPSAKRGRMVRDRRAAAVDPVGSTGSDA